MGEKNKGGIASSRREGGKKERKSRCFARKFNEY